MQHHTTRHHVVHEFVGRNAKAVNGHALPADVGDIKLRQKSRYVRFGDGIEKRHVLQAPLLRLLLQGGFFVAAAHQYKAEGFGLHVRGGLQQHLQRIGRAVRAGIAHHFAASGFLRGQMAGNVCAQGHRFPLPFIQRNAIGHDVQLAHIQPVALHMLSHFGQHAHHHVGMLVRILFCRLAQHDERVPGRHAPQFDG